MFSTQIIFHEMLFHKILFHKIQEKHYEDKAINPRLIILYVGRIVRQEIVDISAD